MDPENEEFFRYGHCPDLSRPCPAEHEGCPPVSSNMEIAMEIAGKSSINVAFSGKISGKII